MYLDHLAPLQSQVGYGQLGLRGSLGYEGKQVRVQRRAYTHALSTHPPARLLYHLGARYGSFRCHVALNDDVAPGASFADFLVLADGQQVALAAHVRAGEPPRDLEASIAGAQLLELVVRTSRWEHCHAVWLDPQLDEGPAPQPTTTIADCLGRADILLPARPLAAERCIATVASAGFEKMLDDMLGSLHAHGGIQDALVVVFVLGDSPASERVAAKYQATIVRCRPHARVNAMSKAILYSLAHVVDARHYLCLDADMLVLGDLQPVFAALEACPEGTILACREGNGLGLHHVGHALTTVYGGTEADLARLLGPGQVDGEATYSLVVNDGLFAGSRTALLALDSAIRAMPGATAWADERRDIWWRNQFIFNLALAHLRCGVELDPTYNVQLHVQDVQLHDRGGPLAAEWRGRPVKVLHFSGVGKRKYPQWKGIYARVAQPLAGPGHGDGYAAFLAALRPWLARHGLPALAWSFYGTVDGKSARVADPSTFPLFAMLHYLLRSNGCTRVLETGTARGVSAACIASAVAHRPDAAVVTLDPASYPERAGLWAALPAPMQACLQARATDSLAGMAAAHAAGERYDAALLDSLHTADHVWAEFQWATRLVSPGGLILIHDAIYPHGTVDQALRRIEAAGYNVVRLWTAETATPEDDHLGLAVIENRLRTTPTHPEPPLGNGDAKPPLSTTDAEPPLRALRALRASRLRAPSRHRGPNAPTPTHPEPTLDGPGIKPPLDHPDIEPPPGTTDAEPPLRALRASRLRAPSRHRGPNASAPASPATSDALPLISCIMPTRGRPAYVLQSLRYFQRQDYPSLELIVVGDDAEDLGPLLAGDPRVRYVPVPPGLSIGAKRNRACEQATGAIIAQWDDDDWYHPHRLSAQVAPLLAGTADLTGLEAGVFFELDRWAFWRCTPALHRRLFVGDVHGGTLVFWRRVWADLARYPDRSLAEDAMFLRQATHRGARLKKLPNDGLYIYLRHGGNAWSFACGQYLDPRGWQQVAEPPLPESDRAFYLSRTARPPTALPPAATPVQAAGQPFAPPTLTPHSAMPAEPTNQPSQPPETPRTAAPSERTGQPFPSPSAPPPGAAPAEHTGRPALPAPGPPVEPARPTLLVSCIMPTANRRQFVPQALRYFLAQDYEPRELIVLDDGDDPVADLIPADPRIRYLRLAARLALGAKRNQANELAAGDVLVHWDDDDWQASWRLSYQVSQLLAHQADICGTSRVLYYQPGTGRSWHYVYPPGGRPWVAGNSLCYTRAFWQHNPFPPISIGEDSRFLWTSRPKQILALDDHRFLVGLIHRHNTSLKRTADRRWQPCATRLIQDLIAADWSFYAHLPT